MRSLRLVMIAHGIPARWTHHLAAGLGIRSVADLAALQIDVVFLVPAEFRQSICDLRNSYKAPDAETWSAGFLDY
jgi:hypothetical protein